VNWHGCALGSRKTLPAASGSCIERLILAFQSSPGMYGSREPARCHDSFPLSNGGVVPGRIREKACTDHDGSHKVGEELARTLIEAAEKSAGSHHSEPYRLRIKYLCEYLDLLRRRLKDLGRDIERKLDDNQVGKLLTTIDGGRAVNCRLSDRRTRRPGTLSERRRDRELCRRYAAPAAVRQEALHAIEQAIQNAKKVYIHDHIDNCVEDIAGSATRQARNSLAEFKQIAKYL